MTAVTTPGLKAHDAEMARLRNWAPEARARREADAKLQPLIRDWTIGAAYRSDPPEAFEATAEQLDAEVEKCIEADEFIEWVSCEFLADDDRVASTAFSGSISPVEMFRIGLNPIAAPEQCKAVFTEMRRLFVDARLEMLTERAEKAAKRAAEDWS